MNICMNCGHSRAFHESGDGTSVPCHFAQLHLRSTLRCICVQYVESTDTAPDKRTVLINELNALEIAGGGELGHIQTDELLLDYINDNEIRDAFERIDKYYA